jgi:EpsI family protein
MFTLEALGLLYMNLMRYTSAVHNVLLALLIVPISFCANIVRVCILVLVTYHFGDEAGQGFVHGFAGIVLFMVALALILATDHGMRLVAGLFGAGRTQPAAPAANVVSDARSADVAPPVSTRRAAVLSFVGLVGAAAVAAWARPTIKVSDQHKDFNLEAIFPKAFGDWVVDPNMPVVLPPPDQQALLEKIYNQTLARTYVNHKGQRVMLSVAYGGDQSDGLTVHIPEVCYVAQGFRLVSASAGTVQIPGQSIPVRNLMMTLGQRQEPVTYWVLMGDEATISNTQRRIVSLRYGLRRLIPEGMLVRVSSINPDMVEAFALHQVFINDLVAAVPESEKVRVVGKPLPLANGG